MRTSDTVFGGIRKYLKVVSSAWTCLGNKLIRCRRWVVNMEVVVNFNHSYLHFFCTSMRGGLVYVIFLRATNLDSPRLFSSPAFEHFHFNVLVIWDTCIECCRHNRYHMNTNYVNIKNAVKIANIHLSECC